MAFETSKKYLDSAGLSALIVKIKGLYDSLTEAISSAESTASSDLAELAEQVAAIYTAATDDTEASGLIVDLQNELAEAESDIAAIYNEATDDTEASGLIVDLQALIDAIRAELGDSEDADESTVYARLTVLEDSLSSESTNLDELTARVDAIYTEATDDAEASGLLVDAQSDIDAIRSELGDSTDAGESTVYARLDAIEEAAATDESNLETLTAAAFTGVTASYSNSDQTITATFTNQAGETVATTTINATDFIINGLLASSVLVTISTEDVTQAYDANGNLYTTSDSVALSNNAGKKYLVITFNTSVDGVTGTSDIWVALDELFNDYDFSASSSNEAYVTLAVTETNYASTNAVNTVVHTLALTDLAVRDFALVEGTAEDSDGNTIRGIEELNSDLATAESAIETLESTINDEESGLATQVAANTTSIESLTSDVATNATNIASNTSAIETLESEVEAWIESDGVIATSDVEASFDYNVYGEGDSDPLAEEEAEE